MRSVDASSTTRSSRSRDRLAENARERGPDVRARRRERRGARRRAARLARTSRSLRPVSRELPSFDLVVATVGRADELGALPRLARGAGLPARARPRRRPERGRAASRRSLAGAARRARARLRSARGLSRARNAGLAHVEADLVAFPDDDCVYPPGLLERVARALRGRRRARRAHRAEPRTRRALVGVVEAGRGDPHGRQPLEPRDLVHDLPPARRRRARRRVRRAPRPRLARSRGRRARRSTTSSARSRRAHGSSTTRRSSSGTTFGRTTRESAPATARASATCCASTATRARVVARMLVRPLGGVARRRSSRLDRRRARYQLATLPRPRSRLPRREAREELGVTVEPGLEREPLDRTRAGGGRRTRVDRRARARPRRRAPRRSGGSSRSKLSGCGTPMPASSPTSSRHAAAARRRRPGSPVAIASITRLGHGSFTFVCRRRCARRKMRGRVALRVPPERRGRGRADRAARRAARPASTRRPVTRSCASGCVGSERRERLERELEPVGLVLVAAEEQHRAAARAAAPRA